MCSGTCNWGATSPAVRRPRGALEPASDRGGESTGSLCELADPGSTNLRVESFGGVKVIDAVYLAVDRIWYERSMTQDKQYWYNVKTGEVEDGPRSMSIDRIGPFATREEAANALATYEARNRAWDEEDEEDDW